MNVRFAPGAWEDYLNWQGADQKILGRINDLIKEIRRTPFTGSGKPEPLRGPLQGYWSRRITQEHRLVYRVSGTGADQAVTIIECRYHY